MHKFTLLARRCGAAALGAMLFTSALPVAHADDTEIFIGGVTTSTIQPNVLFIFDNSGSMDDTIDTQTIYDPSEDYVSDSDCTDGRIYYTTGTGVPSCGTRNWFNGSAFRCAAAVAPLASTGVFINRMARYDTSPTGTTGDRWRDFSRDFRSQVHECEADNGVHGATDTATDLYPRDGNASGYTGSTTGALNWSARTSYRVYSANYVAWYNDERIISRRKIDIAREVLISLLNSVTGINVGLMYFSDNATSNDQGGLVAVPVGDVEDNRAEMITVLNGLNPETFTPLSETMYEAGLYYRGATWDFGSTAQRAAGTIANPSVRASRQATDDTKYKTPMQYSCQKNYIVYLTDGAPTNDTAATTKSQTLIGGNCDLDDAISGADSAATSGVCLDDLAAYYANNDLNSAISGTQSVSTYTIGFATDQVLLSQTALRGGGKYYTANNTAELATAFQGIVAEILDINTTFSSPTVSVNAFNRTQNLNDLYVSVFRPTLTGLWPGNLKKYQLDPVTGEIEDVAGVEAVDADSGFFKDSARSYWSPAVDGAQAAQGGAASQLPAPADRNIYTYYTGSASTTLTNAANAWSTDNTALTAAALATSTSGLSLEDTINWLRGADVFDADSDADVTEARLRMGDPLHARPATVIYGGSASSPDANDAVVYAASNEGLLHAIDVVTGDELWSFVPETTWGSVYRAIDQTSTTNKLSTLDGNVTVLKIDVNFNGVVEPDDGDRVYLYFGQRRGGDNYFALDVTDKESPKFLWRLNSSQLPGLGQTWSTPQVTRINVGGATQNAGKWALVIGGGYEEDQDPNPSDRSTSYSTDSTGNSIYFVDAVSGALLWRAGGEGSDANLELTKMNNAIPGDVRTIDFDGDGFADRLYAGDMGGRVWRFDITNGNSVSSLVAGGVFAALGNADETSHPASSMRRFYSAPDVTLVRRRGQSSFLSVNIGSGYRASPLNEETDDRFYALRDYGLFSRRTQEKYDEWTPISDSAVTDVTDDVAPSIPANSPGWRINLERDGEKVLAEARTFGGVTFFPTFTPAVETSTSSCAPRQGTNRLFAVNVIDGSPVTRDGVTEELTTDDRERELSQGGIAPETVFLFPTPPEDCVGEDCRPPPQCLVGLENCGIEFNNLPVKTFWRERAVQP